MIAGVITYLNGRIGALGYFNEVLCLAEKIEREDKVYPAIYNTNNEYRIINLDANGSLCYWRKNGDITFDKQTSETSIGTQYTASVPLKFVGFVKKENSNNDQYLSDNLCNSIISNLTVNNSALKQILKAKKATFVATKTVTDPKSVGNEEYDNINFEARYTHSYFSIDFQLELVTNSQCYADLCDNVPFNWGYVTVTDNEVEVQVQCGTAYTCTSVTTEVTVSNSDDSYSVTTSTNLELADIAYDVYVNGVLNASGILPSMVNNVINIS
jgi:hypothetical protein